MSAEEDANPHRDPDWLRQKYREEGMTQAEMAELAGVSPPAILHHLQKHGIEKPQLTEDEIIEDLQRVASELERIPTAQEFYDSMDYSKYMVYKHFDTFGELLDAALAARL